MDELFDVGHLSVDDGGLSELYSEAPSVLEVEVLGVIPDVVERGLGVDLEGSSGEFDAVAG